MKIPTLLGLALLTIAIFLGIAIFLYREKVHTALKSSFMPKKIHVVNITDQSATITWQTETPVFESVVFGDSLSLEKSQADDRNRGEKPVRLTHFVTLQGLTEDTQYNFQIKAGQFLYPDQPLSFKTAKKPQEGITLSPIRGSVVDQNLNPIDEALVFLKISGSSDLGSFTTTAGNFILTLKELRNKELTELFPVSPGTEAVLVINRAGLESFAQIILPYNNQTLPPITLGENQDLRIKLASPSAEPTTPLNKLELYDLNSDGQLNVLDVSIVIDNFGNKQKIRQADFNKDGIVDQKDLNLIKKALNNL